MKLKYIVAALGLVASAGSQATLAIPSPGTGTGEMALVIWDANRSYTLDLGLTYAQLLSSGSATLTTLGSGNWTSFLGVADTANWQYALFGGNGNQSPVNNGSILSTINASEVGNVIGTYDNSNVQSGLGQIQAYYNAVNLTGTHNTANGDSVNTKGSGAYFGDTAMDSFNFTLFNNSSAVGTTMALEQLQRTQLTQGLPIERVKGDITFAQVGGSYVLSYSAVAAVPEASGYALALAGFGAVGFVGSRRRKRA